MAADDQSPRAKPIDEVAFPHRDKGKKPPPLPFNAPRTTNTPATASTSVVDLTGEDDNAPDPPPVASTSKPTPHGKPPPSRLPHKAEPTRDGTIRIKQQTKYVVTPAPGPVPQSETYNTAVMRRQATTSSSKGTPIAPQDPTRKLPKQSGTRFGINNGYHASESSTSNSRAPRSLVNIAVVDARKDAQKQSEKIQAYTIPNSSKANQTGNGKLDSRIGGFPSRDEQAAEQRKNAAAQAAEERERLQNELDGERNVKLNSKRPHAGAIVSNLQPRQQPKKNPAQFPPAPSEQPIHNMAIKGKGKQKGQEQDPPPPVPPASPKGKGKGKGKGRAAAKGSDDPAPPKGKKGKDKPTEVIELSDSGDEDDDIEDADGEDSDRRPGPSTRRQSGVSSDDPMGMPPAFNLTSGAAEVASRHKSGGVKPGHVGEMKKVFEPDPPSIASSLKPKQKRPNGEGDPDYEMRVPPPPKKKARTESTSTSGPSPNQIQLHMRYYCLAGKHFPSYEEDTLHTFTLTPASSGRQDRIHLECMKLTEKAKRSTIIEFTPHEDLSRYQLPQDFGVAPNYDPYIVFHLKPEAFERLCARLQLAPGEFDDDDHILSVRFFPLFDKPWESVESVDALANLIALKTRLFNTWTFKGISRSIISGVGGQAHVQQYDERLEAHLAQEQLRQTKARKQREQRSKRDSSTPPSHPPKATKQTTLTTSFESKPSGSKTFKSRLPAQADPTPPVRRSGRASTSAFASVPDDPYPPPVYDPTPTDKVVLIWPHEGVGAVSVTHGDTLRLREEEFLNDSLIELGLKRAFDTVQSKDPELAKQVHMFNSFFYKKLSQKFGKKDDAVAAYATVRKWTAKFDLFSKKYVVVPINEHLHWYLAIIINPAAILIPPTTQRRTRSSLENAGSPELGETSAYFPAPAADPGAEVDDDVEENLLQAPFAAAVSRTDAGPEKEMEVNEEGEITGAVASLRLNGPSAANSTRSSSPMDLDDSSDETPRADPVSPREVETAAGSGTSDDEGAQVQDELVARPVEASTSAAAPAAKPLVAIQPTPITASHEPPKARTRPSSPVASTSAAAISEGQEATDRALAEQLSAAGQLTDLLSDMQTDPTKCYVFTFDSLGGKHVAVEKRLRRYLQSEAEDKKKIVINSAEENTIMDWALVPQQNNFCDCGLYLLHYVEKFLEDPVLMTEKIVTQKARLPSGKGDDAKKLKTAHIGADWDEPVAVGKRVTMRADVEKLRNDWAEWRKPFEAAEQAAKEEKRKRRQGRVGRGKEEKEEKEQEERARKKEASEQERKARRRAEDEKKAKQEDLMGGRAQQYPVVLDTLLGKAPDAKGKGKALLPPPPAKPVAQDQDTMVLTDDDDDDDETISAPAPKKSTSSKPSSTSARILSPPSAMPRKSAPTSKPRPPTPPRPRETTPVASTSTQAVETITISPAGPASPSGTRGRPRTEDSDPGGSPDSSPLPKKKRPRAEKFRVEVPPSPQPTHTRFIPSGPPPSPKSSAGSSKENAHRAVTPAGPSASQLGRDQLEKDIFAGLPDSKDGLPVSDDKVEVVGQSSAKPSRQPGGIPPTRKPGGIPPPPGKGTKLSGTKSEGPTGSHGENSLGSRKSGRNGGGEMEVVTIDD